MVFPTAPLQMLVTNIDYDEHKGRIAIGRVTGGTIKKAQQVCGALRLRVAGLRFGLERLTGVTGGGCLGVENCSGLGLQGTSGLWGLELRVAGLRVG